MLCLETSDERILNFGVVAMRTRQAKLRSHLSKNIYLSHDLLAFLEVRTSAKVVLISSVQIINRLDSQSKLQMVTLFSTTHQYGVPILGSLNLCETFRRISEVWENGQAFTLEKCLPYLVAITSQVFEFIH